MSITARPVVFSDTISIPRIGARARTATLVVGFALFTALMAQIQIHLAWTPVPITGQTLAVLLAGAALGSRLGAISQIAYLAMGLFLPFYADGADSNRLGESGWHVVSGATGGYLIGMVVAAYLVGLLAERHEDRSFLTSLPAMLLGSAVVYAFGAPWLAHVAHLSAIDAVNKGVAPFIVGDALKSIIAGAALPAAWMLTQRKSS